MMIDESREQLNICFVKFGVFSKLGPNSASMCHVLQIFFCITIQLSCQTYATFKTMLQNVAFSPTSSNVMGEMEKWKPVSKYSFRLWNVKCGQIRFFRISFIKVRWELLYHLSRRCLNRPVFFYLTDR